RVHKAVIIGKLNDGRMINGDVASDIFAAGNGALPERVIEREVGVVAIAHLPGAVENGGVSETSHRVGPDVEDRLLRFVARTRTRKTPACAAASARENGTVRFENSVAAAQD